MIMPWTDSSLHYSFHTYFFLLYLHSLKAFGDKFISNFSSNLLACHWNWGFSDYVPIRNYIEFKKCSVDLEHGLNDLDSID